jgi:hypothetical protein
MAPAPDGRGMPEQPKPSPPLLRAETLDALDACSAAGVPMRTTESPADALGERQTAPTAV